MRLITSLPVPVALVVFPAIAGAVTIHVPGDYATVCEATAVAQYGDTVLVAPGSYEYPEAACVPIPDGVVLTSEQGPQVTVLYAWEGGPIANLIEFAPDVSSATELSGLTILCADLEGASAASAIYCHGGSPTIRGNVIRSAPGYPYALAEGAGVYCMSSSATIANNTLVISPLHEEMYSFSCGVLATGTSAMPLISHNIIVTADYGIRCSYGASPVISCNNFWDVEDVYTSGCTPGPEDFFEDPRFCDPGSGVFSLHCESPAAHGYGCGLMGALPVGCGATKVEHQSWSSVRIRFR